MRAVCTFCGERPVVAWFNGPVKTIWLEEPEVFAFSDDDYLACATCLELIEAGDRDRLSRREMHRMRDIGAAEFPHLALLIARISQVSFWDAWMPRVDETSGAPRPVRGRMRGVAAPKADAAPAPVI
jgi:hypothetical protein